MAATLDQVYTSLTDHVRETALLGSCAAVLGWDEQTYMPPAGGEHRANQLALLAGMTHERATDQRIGDWLTHVERSALTAEGDSVTAVNIREIRRDYDHATKLPRRLVEELSRVATLGQQAWVEARKASDFTKFLPWLDKMVKLKREEAQAVGYGAGVPLDALLDQHEPGMTTTELTRLFTPLREELVKLIAAIRDSGKQPDRSILTRNYPIDAQREFSLQAARSIGFDLNAGRLDIAAHPFCSGFGPGDVRLTTRYDAHHFPGAFFGTLHEAGHGIYEQGLEATAFGLGMGSAVSLGIHESQSRLWENFVGRSHAFWEHFYGPAQQAFPEALGSTTLDQFHAAVNDVQPSFIRVEADEATYNLHILLRFELEQPLISGELQPKDLPGVWNEKFTRYFGITPPNDSQGCLQDIHWSAGLLGYFPTYTLGNMNAAQLYDAAEGQLGNLHAQFARGEFAPLKHWLNEQIHSRGKQYHPSKLIELVTGKPLSHIPLMRHLRTKFGELYGLS